MLLHSNNFCSLKKVQGKKKRDAAVAEANRIAEAESSADSPAESPSQPELLSEPSAGDLLSSKDEDVIF